MATPQSETGSGAATTAAAATAATAATATAAAVTATADAYPANHGTSDLLVTERTEGRGRSGEEGAAFEGGSHAIMLPLTRTANDGGRAILSPAAASAASFPSCSVVTVAHGGDSSGGGGGSGGSGSDGAGGGRPGLGPRAPSVSAALTQKEGLIHKVNAGLSGLETSIFFQLMLPESSSSSSHPEAGRVVPSRASAAAPPNGGAAALAPRSGPYPTFSGGASKELVAAPEDRFAGLSSARYVASYLRRRRWLWSFACPDAPNFGGACLGGGMGAVAGDDGGCDAAEWTTCRRKIINSLARSRRADGFVLVECKDNEALMVKGIRIMLGVLPGGSGGAGGDGRGWGGGGGGGAEAGAGVGNDGDRGGAGNSSAVRGEDAGRAGEDRGRGGGAGSSGAGDGAGSRQPDGSGQGGPRAMRVILQYRVFEVSAFALIGFVYFCWFRCCVDFAGQAVIARAVNTLQRQPRQQGLRSALGGKPYVEGRPV